MRYSRACSFYQDFHDRGLLLTRRLLNQGFLLVKLNSSLRKISGRHHDLVDCYGISVSQTTTDRFHLSFHFSVLSSMTYHRVCNQINATGATSGVETAYPSGTPVFTPSFQWGSCCSIFSFMCMFCRSLFVLFLLAIVLSVFLRFTDSDYPFGILDLQILITPLVSQIYRF